VVNAGGVLIGEGMFQVISGPCSVESEEQIIEVAKSVKASGATLLRGGVFMGLQEDGLRLRSPRTSCAAVACCGSSRSRWPND
jgi:3-deoxy-7-phosphoheptulonate synthase